MIDLESSRAIWRRHSSTAMMMILMLALPVLAVRLVYINTIKSDELLTLARRQQESHSVIPARRGRILDRRNRCLATTRYAPDVFIDPTMIGDNIGDVAGALAARLNLDKHEILAEIVKHPESHYIVLARRVDEVTAEAVRDLKCRGVGLTNREQRTYPLEDSMAHVLGFVGTDGHGLEGIELQFDSHLAGFDGRLSSIRDARRRALYQDADRHRAPVDGGDVVLTTDAVIQRIVEKAVAEQVTKHSAERGLGIVMVPRTGEILAMACVPTFDANSAAKIPAQTRRNRVITDPVEPGSTFKPFIAGGALAAEKIDITEEFDCHQGSFRIGRRVIKDTHSYGKLDITGVITKSSNIAMAQIGERMGNPLLHQTMRSFGFGERTGISLPGESSGVVYPLRKWDSFSTASVTFGYEVGITPLQLITGFCALLNDGVLIKPRIVAELHSYTGKVIRRFDAVEEKGETVPPEVARFLTHTAMRSVVANGTVGKHMKGGYSVLGKTGTAKLLKPDRTGYQEGSYLGTFMGAAPLDDPRIAVVVMIRRPDPTTGYYGGIVAAPAVGRIIASTLEYLEVVPDKQLVSTGG
ncbi:MAG: peptidoglycan D,D-transpeptidase FtsI family protein [Planctomycetota bacterium]|jgi:cell division protein FtsI/penicillin-binding protein 2